MYYLIRVHRIVANALIVKVGNSRIWDVKSQISVVTEPAHQLVKDKTELDWSRSQSHGSSTLHSDTDKKRCTKINALG